LIAEAVPGLIDSVSIFAEYDDGEDEFIGLGEWGGDGRVAIGEGGDCVPIEDHY